MGEETSLDGSDRTRSSRRTPATETPSVTKANVPHEAPAASRRKAGSLPEPASRGATTDRGSRTSYPYGRWVGREKNRPRLLAGHRQTLRVGGDSPAASGGKAAGGSGGPTGSGFGPRAAPKPQGPRGLPSPPSWP